VVEHSKVFDHAGFFLFRPNRHGPPVLHFAGRDGMEKVDRTMDPARGKDFAPRRPRHQIALANALGVEIPNVTRRGE
jgi:hypothetical protein